MNVLPCWLGFWRDDVLDWLIRKIPITKIPIPTSTLAQFGYIQRSKFFYLIPLVGWFRFGQRTNIILNRLGFWQDSLSNWLITKTPIAEILVPTSLLAQLDHIQRPELFYLIRLKGWVWLGRRMNILPYWIGFWWDRLSDLLIMKISIAEILVPTSLLAQLGHIQRS